MINITDVPELKARISVWAAPAATPLTVLHSGVACISDLIVKEGLINLDLADVLSIMQEKGKAMMGKGEASGASHVLKAAVEAISNPLIEDPTIKRASGLIISITGGNDLTLFEVDQAASRIREEADQDPNIIVGATFDERLEGADRVSVVETGIDNFDPSCQIQAAKGPFRISPIDGATSCRIAALMARSTPLPPMERPACRPMARSPQEIGNSDLGVRTQAVVTAWCADLSAYVFVQIPLAFRAHAPDARGAARLGALVWPVARAGFPRGHKRGSLRLPPLLVRRFAMRSPPAASNAADHCAALNGHDMLKIDGVVRASHEELA
ncbi:cell division protein FtsZ [Bradyrhizobium brasilense]|uniref:cell division protein FtsZ n=1 Tax=Bradyrhizobium brasilense TaxID=1419277 RepID=UPI003CC5A1FB